MRLKTWKDAEMTLHTHVLTEMFAQDPVAGGTSEYFSALGDKMSSEYSALGVLSSAASALAHVLQTCHWQARGDSFYGDHKLFEELYSDTSGEVDEIAERAVGMGSPLLVHPVMRTEQISEFVRLYVGDNSSSFPRSFDLLTLAFSAETLFLGFVKTSLEILEKNGELTQGIENMLGNIADKHEKHVYLLSQALRR